MNTLDANLLCFGLLLILLGLFGGLPFFSMKTVWIRKWGSALAITTFLSGLVLLVVAVLRNPQYFN